MGRFDDRIRFRNDGNTAYVSPSRVQVRNLANTAWIDYGTNESANTKEIRVRNTTNTDWVRVTRNRQEQLNFKFVNGTMSVSNGQNFNNYSESTSVFHRIIMTFKTSVVGVEQVLARNAVDANSYWELGLDSSNRFYYEGRFSGQTPVRRTHTGFTVSSNTWVTVEVELNSSNALRIRVNNGAWTSLGTSSRISFSATRSISVGTNNMSFRGQFRIDGTAGGSASTQRSIDVNIENATVGSAVNLAGTNGTLTSTNTVQGDYTITWV